MVSGRTRRGFLAGSAAGVAGALAGCTGVFSADDTTPSHPEGAFPLRDRALYVHDDFKLLRGYVVSGGVPRDAIPPVDEPTFESAGSVGDRILPEDPVFGVRVNGEAKAYPQSILVWHEIVNDVVGGVPVTVTYCPLTGSALGFYRGENTFGTTGNLLNSNLVMYDRETDSRWPQLLGTAIEGEHEGDSLSGVRVTWTTWERWQDRQPDTLALTRETGYVRDYGGDPYGTYNPKAGYYATQGKLYDPLRAPGRTPPKLVFVAARTPTGSFAASKKRLREERIVAGTAGDVPVVAVYDPDLDTGYVYERPADETVAPGDGAGTYRVGGESASADGLPLPALVDFDVMWFSWNAFYPNTDAYD